MKVFRAGDSWHFMSDEGRYLGRDIDDYPTLPDEACELWLSSSHEDFPIQYDPDETVVTTVQRAFEVTT